jgi:Rod binding domain-containing protein
MDAIRLTAPVTADAADPSKVRRIQDAARQFEALLIEQLLRSARGSGEGWLGGGEDGPGGIATGFAEQQLAIAMSAQGGLGLASLIVQGLERGAARSPEPE